MARAPSRAKRCSQATSELSEAAALLREIVEDMESDEYSKKACLEKLAKADEAFNNGKSEIEELKGEIESWKDNLEGANMEHLPKYEEVSEAYDQLEAATDALDSIEIPSDLKGDDLDLDALAEEIDNAQSEAENVSFPGMF